MGLKKCLKEGCGNNRFSHGFCSFHQYLRTDRKWLISIENNKAKGILSNHNIPITGKSNLKAKDLDVLLCYPPIKENSPTNNLESTDIFVKKTIEDYGAKKYPLIEAAFAGLDNNLSNADPKPSSAIKKNRSSKIRTYSLSKQKKKNIIAGIKKQLIEDFGEVDMLDGNYCANPDAFHIFPIGKFPEYETEHWNIILSSRKHNLLWDQGTYEKLKEMPGLRMLFKIIWDKDNDPNKKHKGSFYEQLMNRKNK